MRKLYEAAGAAINAGKLLYSDFTADMAKGLENLKGKDNRIEDREDLVDAFVKDLTTKYKTYAEDLC